MKTAGSSRVQNKWAQKLFFVLSIVLASSFTGCAVNYQVQEMALSPEDRLSDLQGNYISLFSINTDNQFKPTWPPEVSAIEITDQRTEEKIVVSLQSMSKMDLLKKGLSETFTFDEGGPPGRAWSAFIFRRDNTVLLPFGDFVSDLQGLPGRWLPLIFPLTYRLRWVVTLSFTGETSP